MEEEKRAEEVHHSPHAGQPECGYVDRERGRASGLNEKENWHTMSTRNKMEGCKGERNGMRMQVVLLWK